MSKRTRFDKNISCEMYNEITSIEDIPVQTSKWNEEHRKVMMIEFKNAESVHNITSLSKEYSEEWNKINTWNRNKFRNANAYDLDQLVNTLDNRMITILEKGSRIVYKEETDETVR